MTPTREINSDWLSGLSAYSTRNSSVDEIDERYLLKMLYT